MSLISQYTVIQEEKARPKTLSDIVLPIYNIDEVDNCALGMEYFLHKFVQFQKCLSVV